MKQILQQFTLRASLLVMLLVGAIGNAWGEEVTYDFSSGGAYDSSSKTIEWITSNFTILQAGVGGTAVNPSYVSSPRWYQYHKVTFTPSQGVNITKIVINCSSSYNGQTITASTGNISTNGNNTTWTGTISSTTPVILTMGKQCRPNSVVVTYTSSGSTTETVATPTFSPAAGTYTSSQNVTISTETSGATIYYTTDGNDPTTNSSTYNSAISVSQTTTIKAMAVKEGMDNSAVAEATYTINIPETNVNWVETSLADLSSTDVFVIVGNNYAMTNNNGTSSAPTAVSVTIAEGKITSAVNDNIKWNVGGNATDGYTFYPNGSTSTWLYCNTNAASSSNNNLRVGTGDRKLFKPDGNGYFVTNDTYTSRYISIYNNSDWRGYVNTTNGAVALKFYKRVDADAPQPPFISASNVNLTYDATEGSITYAVNNPVAGGSITAVSSENWLIVGTASNGTIALTCTANSEPTERTATVILTYSYSTNETVTKEVTVTQAAAPVIYSTIPALFAASSTTEAEVKVTFNNWVVSGVSTNGKNVFVTDNDGNGFVIFDNAGSMNETYPVGSILSGAAVSCHLLKYNGFAEIKNLNASDLTITTGGTVTASNIAMADLAGVNTGALVSYENLTCSVSSGKYYLSDGTTTIQVFNSLFAFDALENGKTYNITGIYQQFNDTKEILPRSATDIQEVTVTSTLSWTVGTNIELFVYDAADQNNPLSSPANVTAGTEILVSVDAAEGYVLESLIVDGEDVTSQVDETGAYTFTMPGHAVTISATATQGSITPVTDGKYVKVTSTNVLASGQYLIVYEDDGVAFNGSLETLDAANNTISVTLNDTVIAVTTETTAAEFTIDISAGTIKSASGYYIGRTTDSNGMNSSATEKYTNTISMDADGNAVIQSSGSAYMRYNATSGQDRFRYFKSSTYTSQKAIQLYKKVEVTVGSVGYTTFVAPAAVSFPEGVEAFIVTAISTNSIHMEPVTAVPSGTPVVVKASEGTHELSVATETDDVTDNLLLASDGNVTGDGTIYALGNKSAGVGFYPVKSGAKVPAGKAYLEVNNDNVKEFFSFDFGGLVTEINNVNTDFDANAEIYNLAGQRVQKAQKGFYIIGGKKVLVK